RLVARKNLSQDGFTVIELVIVIVVLMILIGLIITTYGGIQEKNRNYTRNTNLEAIHKQIEKYFNDSTAGHYPSRADMNNSAWLAKNLPSLDPGLLIDPSSPNKSPLLVATPKAKAFAYAPTQIDGVTSCEAKDITCAKYTLTATYEGTVNGTASYTIKSTN
ncbi:MAG: prepilin-type N-terminal cleavage/methylation domain-containing protein, partial [Candidatus Saccharimonadales bacterium]